MLTHATDYSGTLDYRCSALGSKAHTSVCMVAVLNNRVPHFLVFCSGKTSEEKYLDFLSRYKSDDLVT